MKVLVTGGSGFIGTHLVECLAQRGHSVLNLDIAAPHLLNHHYMWKNVDILDKVALEDGLGQFRPEVVIHLAARTDTDSDRLADYEVNTVGTENLLRLIKKEPSVKRFILTSTQFVNQYNGIPRSDTDFAPHTAYGESKVIAEQMTRGAALNCTWLIVRPTNVWGAWHKRYPVEFWAYLSKGLYVHPGYSPVTRAYGYVGNVVQQFDALMTAPEPDVNANVFYVGDEPIELYEWVNGFSLAQIGRPVRRVPRAAVKLLAKVGDGLKMLGVKFPITGSRYKSMTHSNSISMSRTFQVCGRPPSSLSQGIAETVAWMRMHHPELVKHPEGK